MGAQASLAASFFVCRTHFTNNERVVVMKLVSTSSSATKVYLKLYFIISTVMIIGLCTAVGLMFSYLRTINANIACTEASVLSAADNASNTGSGSNLPNYKASTFPQCEY